MTVAKQTPILELNGIRKSYGGSVALKSGGLRVYPGEVHALMGGNGAGKSTMIKIISGAQQADEGEIIVDGKHVSFKTPRDSMKHGIAVVYQELSLIPHLTVAENIAISCDEVYKGGRFDWQLARKIAAEALTRLGGAASNISPDEKVLNLRTDQMQMVEIARAVGQNAKIILLDEPTSSLNFEETEAFFQVVRSLCSQGLAIVFVSHRMKEIRELCSRITILRDGVVVADAALMSEKSDDEIICDMLGNPISAQAETEKRASTHTQELLSFSFSDGGESYAVHKGEIVGLAGLAGSGRSSVLRSIWGGSVRNDMNIRYLGAPHKPKRPMQALKKKIAYIGESRAEMGLFFGQPISETIIMAHRNLKKRPIVKGRDELKICNDILDKVQIKVPRIDCTPSALSGGNQQKLLFGRWLVDESELVLLDEPTRGVDIRTKNEIYQRIRQMAGENEAGVLMVTSELEEMALLCDKVIIMRDGRATEVLTGDEISESNIMAHITAASGVAI